MDAEFVKEFEEKCKKGEHPLIEIYSFYDGIAEHVVRWCPVCGAIVVDADVDGRTFPGRFVPMRLPKSAS